MNIHKESFFCKLIQNDRSVIEIEGSGILTSGMTSQYRDTTDSVIIGNLCTSIGGDAFYNWQTLQSITIGENVTSIGSWSLGYCIGLTSIHIPKNLINIDSDSFNGSQQSILNITVDPRNPVYDSRQGCNAIIETSTNTTVLGCRNTVIPNTVTCIGEDTFYYCFSLPNIVIPDSVTEIGIRAFQACREITDITIPDSVSVINDGAFMDCISLSHITFGSGLTTFNGESTFAGCNLLKSITSLATVAPTISSRTFYNLDSSNGTLYVPAGSTGYNTWMSSVKYYLGYYSWTKVEQ